MRKRRSRRRGLPRQEGRGLVKVAWAQNQAEAELIEGLLRDAGIPSMIMRSPGFDVPDFLAAGPRDVLVPEAAADEAREILNAD